VTWRALSISPYRKVFSCTDLQLMLCGEEHIDYHMVEAVLQWSPPDWVRPGGCCPLRNRARFRPSFLGLTRCRVWYQFEAIRRIRSHQSKPKVLIVPGTLQDQLESQPITSRAIRLTSYRDTKTIILLNVASKICQALVVGVNIFDTRPPSGAAVGDAPERAAASFAPGHCAVLSAAERPGEVDHSKVGRCS
jgi:hypothetical protein